MNDTVFDDTRTYRYSLVHTWDASLPTMTFVMLNPSTADEQDLDPTLRRCKGFAIREGYGSIRVLNLYAYRTKDPKELFRAEDPVGPENDDTLAGLSGPVVAAWGGDAKRERVRRALEILPRTLLAFGFTKSGQPWHPLYLPRDLELTEWKR